MRIDFWLLDLSELYSMTAMKVKLVRIEYRAGDSGGIRPTVPVPTKRPVVGVLRNCLRAFQLFSFPCIYRI